MNYLQKVTYILRQGDNLYQLSQTYQTTVSAILALNTSLDPYNLPVGKTIIIPAGERYRAMGQVLHTASSSPQKQIQLNKEMRLAWSQHVYWTRMLLISIAERLADEKEVAGRLLQNPEDIAQIFAKYYSPETAHTIARLLTEHLEIGGKLITALRDGDAMAANHLNDLWYKNADQMAAAFASINPYYKKEELRKMLYRHLELTTEEVGARLAKKYREETKAFDKVEQEAMEMADYFTDGIIKQFPNRF